mmetsp:Transcript_36042/g.49142  ORF Transcript_36042/g.49142 Transcript_36042/m.49142 type:complete len:99 (-) Transcript_36042:259-555(-)
MHYKHADAEIIRHHTHDGNRTSKREVKRDRERHVHNCRVAALREIHLFEIDSKGMKMWSFTDASLGWGWPFLPLPTMSSILRRFRLHVGTKMTAFELK